MEFFGIYLDLFSIFQKYKNSFILCADMEADEERHFHVARCADAMWKRMCAYVRARVCMCARVCVCVCARVCVCVCVHMCD